MISKEEAAAQFKQILATKPGWAKLAKSQFVDHLAVFMSWALRAALWVLERMEQEFFLSTAVNKSSILAHVEDREYIPRKLTPASGSVTIKNNGANPVSLPIYASFASDVPLNYVTLDVVTIQPGETETAEIEQRESKTTEFDPISESKAYLEFLFSKEDTESICSFRVYVDEGEGFEEWTYARLFQNSYADSKVFDEFFNHNGQGGIRFGNGTFGKMPEVNAVVKVEMWTTTGDTSLLSGKTLYPVGDVLDDLGDPADITVLTAETISGGGTAEGTEEMRVNLHYWPTYNEKLVWQEDYEFYIKKNTSGLTWLRVWGEEEAEAAYGFSFDHVNKIFISAYKPGYDIQSTVLALFDAQKTFNRKFVWVAPAFSNFSMAITGTVPRSVVIADAKSVILTALKKKYSKDSLERKRVVAMKDIYKILSDTGYFPENDETVDYSVVLTGTTVPTLLHEMVCLDELMTVDNIVLTYPTYY